MPGIPGLFLSSLIAGGEADAHWSKTQLLLTGENGATGDNNISTYDEAYTQANNWTYGGTTSWSTAQQKYGSSSLAFDGSNYFTSTGSWIPDTSNFCWEAWIRPTDLTSKTYFCIVDMRNGAGIGWDGWFLNYINGTGLCLEINGVQSSPGAMSINTWYHIAALRSGSSMYLFENGSLVDSIGTGSVSGTGIDHRIGAFVNSTSYNFEGYMDDIRFTWNTARYSTSGFTVPDRTLPNY